MWLKSKFFENFDQNRIFFENLIKIEISRKFWPKSKFFRKFDLDLNFTKIWAKSEFIEIFENIQQNRNFYNSSKIEIFLENLTKI